MGWNSIILSIKEGCRGAIIVGIACSIVGIIVGTITLTSLGLVIGNNMLYLAGDNLFLAGFFTMIISIILGMGMPATAAYIIVDRKSTRLNSSHVAISYAVFCLKKKNMNSVYVLLV